MTRLMTKTSRKKKETSVVGTYVYDKKLGRLVKVSDRIPRVSARSQSSDDASCGQGACASGPCGRGMCES